MIAPRNAEYPARACKDTQDLSQSVTASSSPQWARELQESRAGGRSEVSGYVPSHIIGISPRPIHIGQEAQWSNQSSFVDPRPFQADYHNYMDPSDQPGDSSGFPFPSGFYEQPLSQSMDYTSEANLGQSTTGMHDLSPLTGAVG